jgi:hypothetical protein
MKCIIPGNHTSVTRWSPMRKHRLFIVWMSTRHFFQQAHVCRSAFSPDRLIDKNLFFATSRNVTTPADGWNNRWNWSCSKRRKRTARRWNSESAVYNQNVFELRKFGIQWRSVFNRPRFKLYAQFVHLQWHRIKILKITLQASSTAICTHQLVRMLVRRLFSN